MKTQPTSAGKDFERLRKPTRRETFLTEMNAVLPWGQLAVAFSQIGGRRATAILAL